MIDQNFDLAQQFKCAHVDDEKWLCWCFPLEKEEARKPDIPCNLFTRIVEVHRLWTKDTVVKYTYIAVIFIIKDVVSCGNIRSRKQGDTDGTSNIVLPCPGS